MSSVGLFDRDIISDRGTFEAINLGHSNSNTHNIKPEVFARAFVTEQTNLWNKRNAAVKQAWRHTVPESKWVNTEFYKNCLIMPTFTECHIHEITMKKNVFEYGILRAGKYYVMCIGSVYTENVCRKQFIKWMDWGTENAIFGFSQLDTMVIKQAAAQYNASEHNGILFAALWGMFDYATITLFVEATSIGERLVHSMKNCIRQGDMLISPTPNLIFPMATGGLVLANMEKFEKMVFGT